MSVCTFVICFILSIQFWLYTAQLSSKETLQNVTMCEDLPNVNITCGADEMIAFESVRYFFDDRCASTCCTYDATDATVIGSTSDTNNIRMACSGQSSCSIDLSDSHIFGSAGSKPSSYIVLQYYCIPKTRITSICSSETIQSDGLPLYLAYVDYPDVSIGTNSCSCSLEVYSCSSDVIVYTIDADLYIDETFCYQSLVFMDGSSSTLKSIHCESYYASGIVQESLNSHYIEVTFTSVSEQNLEGQFFIALEAAEPAANFSLSCSSIPVSFCTVIVTSCEELIDSYGTWKTTLIGAAITLGCQSLYEGSYSRQCKSDGVWGSVTNHCTVKQAVFNELHDQVKMLLNSEIDVSGAVEDVAKNLTQLTTDSETDSEVVENVVEIVQNLVILVETTKKITDNGTKYIFEAISNMINPENEEAWTAEETGVKGSKVLSIVDGIVTVLQEIKCGQLNAGEVDNVNTENIYAEILKLSSVDISFPASKQTESAIDIPAAALSALGISDACFGGSYYSSVGGIIEDELLTADGSVESFHTGQRVNSDVISGQLPSVDGNKYYSLSPPVRIKLALKNTTYINPVCVFWDYNITTSGRNGAWSSKGCNLTDITNTSVTCECTHLTNFAILMSPSKIPNKHAQVLGIISAVGCGISMVCLILTIAAHFMVWRFVRSDRSIILMNLCVALLLALGIFLVGIELTESRKVCAAIAAIIQVLFLAVFFFMLLIGVEILICVVHVFVTKFRIKILLPVAWLAPMVIVGISLVVTNAEGYGNDRYCWLDVESGLIWSFIGPAAFVIFVNFVIILVVFKKIASSAVVKSKKMAIKIKTGIRSLCVLLPLMGITWVFGLLSVNSSFVVFQYLFCVMNTLQGLFIFLFHCVFNRQIRDAIRRRQARSRSLATFSSDMRKNSDTRKSRSLSKDLKPPNSPTFDKSQNDVDNKAYDMHG